jgi:squalene-associated FAD-dependent desaturase
MKLAIIGAGWAGLAAAVTAVDAGQTATVFEASNAVGGRARALKDIQTLTLPNGQPTSLDNGQHILIGAYTETLRLIRSVGLSIEDVLLNLPLTLAFPDGQGLQFKNWPTPLDALGGIVSAHGWSVADKASLLRAAAGWQLAGFACQPDQSVAQLCQRLTPRVNTELIEPLCVSALNTPAPVASAQVFLRVLRDALFSVSGGSRLLLPKVDLSHLFPKAAAAWLKRHGSEVRLGQRIQSVLPQPDHWRVDGERFDAVILATSSSDAARLLASYAQHASEADVTHLKPWLTACQGLQFQPIATVYAWAAAARLSQPMLALRSTPSHPAQFVFDRGQLGGESGLLAFVVSAAHGDRATLEAQVLSQAQTQLGLSLQAVQTVVEKRATFACTPGLQRPPAQVLPGLLACGDYIEGPYPATLEGAVRSGISAALSLKAMR